MKFCYSVDEEQYHGDCDTREDAVAEVQDLLDDYEPGTTVTICTAEVVSPMVFLRRKMKRHIENLIECMDEQLYDEIAGDDMGIMHLDDKADEVLAEVVANFIEEHATFRFHAVDNIQKHEVVVEGERA